MPVTFQIAAGTIQGRDHVLAGKNNQDSLFWETRGGCTALVVCDGCGSSAHSETGAWLGARWTADVLLSHLDSRNPKLDQPDGIAAYLEFSRQLIVSRLATALAALNGDPRAFLHDAFLFTVVGALITPEWTAAFSMGDGVAALNGEVTTIGPFPGNEPPYLSYAIREKHHRARPFELLRVMPTSDVHTLLIGTDGLADWSGLETKRMPGRADTAGPLKQFWEDEKYFANPDAIRRKLALMNRAVTTPDWELRSLSREPGLLRDDTTLIVARKASKNSSAPSPASSAIQCEKGGAR